MFSDWLERIQDLEKENKKLREQMSKVFCVFQDYYDRELDIHQELIGVYSTKEKALEEIDKMIGDGYYVEEYEIDV